MQAAAQAPRKLRIKTLYWFILAKEVIFCNHLSVCLSLHMGTRLRKTPLASLLRIQTKGAVSRFRRKRSAGPCFYVLRVILWLLATLWKLIKPDTETTEAGDAGFTHPQNFPYKSESNNSYFRSEVAMFPLWMSLSSCTAKGSSVKITIVVVLKHFLTSIEQRKACKQTAFSY